MCLLLFPMAIMAQHTIIKNNGRILSNVKITDISDSTMTYQLGTKKNMRTETISLFDVASYKLQDGVTHHVGSPNKLSKPIHDTLISIVKDTIETALLLQYADNQNKALAKAFKTTGTVSLSIGVPCLAAGIASLVYAEFIPNPTDGYTTSQTLADQDANLQYMSTSEYVSKLQAYNSKVRTLSNAGYICTGAGAALTIVGIPLYCCGKHLMTLEVNYTGNGAGLTLNF